MRSRLLVAAASLAAVLLAFVLDLDRTSPGPISAPHAALEALAGGASCAACHGRLGERLSAACGECHRGVSGSLAAGRGLHGGLDPALAADCGACHREHLGAEAPLVGESAFRRAGYAGRAAYDHAGLDFRPLGFHAELECARCHRNADAERLPAGEARFLGLSGACDACHDDPHGGRMERACSACHDQEHRFEDRSGFVHTGAFPLSGAHAGLSCGSCHERGGEHAVEVLLGSGPRPAARGCADCHGGPHGAEVLEGVAGALGLEPAASCGACHGSARGGFTGFDRISAPGSSAWSPGLHALTGFPLERPHDRLECSACHAGGAPDAPFAARFPGRSRKDCAACHDDPHGGTLDDSPLAPRGCVDCHGLDAFAPSRVGLEQHAGCGFELTGSHGAVACSGCHPALPGASPGGRRFRGTPRHCAACHVDPHRGRFDSARIVAAVPATREGRRDCARCHDELSFAPAREGFDHRWTGYELDGPHGRLECSACHPPGGNARLGPAAGVGCADCHGDPHLGQLAREGKTDCARCHAGPETLTFDHGRDARFALDERHASLPCGRCHQPWLLPGGAEVVRYRPLGVTCRACHGTVPDSGEEQR